MNENVTLRRLRRDDIPALVDIENRTHYRMDPDFGVKAVGPDAWTAADIHAAVYGDADTRGWVVEEGVGNVVAYFIYERLREGFLIVRLIVDPQYRNANVGRTILWTLYQRACLSNVRKTLLAYVPETDRDTCEWLAHMGFFSRLLPLGWDDETDAIEFSFTTTEYVDRETGERYERTEGEKEQG